MSRPAEESAPVRRPGAWTRLLFRSALVVSAAALAVWLPLPLLDAWLPSKHVVAAVAVVLVLGKLLYDTLFYER